MTLAGCGELISLDATPFEAQAHLETCLGFGAGGLFFPVGPASLWGPPLRPRRASCFGWTVRFPFFPGSCRAPRVLLLGGSAVGGPAPQLGEVAHPRPWGPGPGSGKSAGRGSWLSRWLDVGPSRTVYHRRMWLLSPGLGSPVSGNGDSWPLHLWTGNFEKTLPGAGEVSANVYRSPLSSLRVRACASVCTCVHVHVSVCVRVHGCVCTCSTIALGCLSHFS